MALHVRALSESDLKKHLPDIAASFQEAAVEVLVDKTIRAARQTGVRNVTLSGGVASNSRLKMMMQKKLENIGGNFYFPPPFLCTDNSAMIAAAGYRKYKMSGSSNFNINAVPYLKLQ